MSPEAQLVGGVPLSQHTAIVNLRRGTGTRTSVVEQNHSLRSHDPSNPSVHTGIAV
jgi:hypothetical protein